MHGDPRIIDMLNQVLRKELTGINQYFIHSRMCENWDYEVLTKAHYDESIDEMKHADEIIRRILFLEDVPNMSDYDPIRISRTVKEQFDNDLALEMAAINRAEPSDADGGVTNAVSHGRRRADASHYEARRGFRGRTIRRSRTHPPVERPRRRPSLASIHPRHVIVSG